MRKFGNKKIELLAPAGNFEIFKGIVESKCDAIYFGGQRMNMRMIRKGYNFSDDELKEAINLAGEKGKATYITVNNLLDHDESDTLDAYLNLLSKLKPTGIIVQDFAVLSRINALNLKLDVHASVMMNVHNLEMIKALEKHNVKRVVLSRESTLADAHYFHTHSNVELEYFTHGDMCVAHGSQCYHSSIIFGMSSNRGKCLKPCRWGFDIGGEKSYPFAVKDMSMISNLPEMIHAGITSFKIEGRMREKEFIVNLINQYGEVFDRYIEDPIGYDFDTQQAWIYKNRKRDLSTAYAFGNPGLSNINSRYEGTGKFYSTGKMFSTPTEESAVDETQIESLKTVFCSLNTKRIKLSVRVEDMNQAMVALEEGVDRIYLAADVLSPRGAFTIKNIQALIKVKGQTELYLSTPKMMDDAQIERYDQWLQNIMSADEGALNAIGVDGLLVTNLGAIEAFKKYNLRLIGDYSLNIFNKHAAAFYVGEGLSEITPSIELAAEALSALLIEEAQFEVISHGRLTTMYMSHDFYDVYHKEPKEELVFENEAGAFLVKRDVFGKNHLLMHKHYTLLPILNRLKNANVRIEAKLESSEQLRAIIKGHFSAISGDESAFKQLQGQLPELEFTFGASRF